MFRLKVPADEAIRRISDRIDALARVPRNEYGLEYYELVKWCSTTWQTIDAISAPDDLHPEEIRSIGLQNCSCNSHTKASILADAYHDTLLRYIDEIRAG
jgi:hypothetical protein